MLTLFNTSRLIIILLVVCISQSVCADNKRFELTHFWQEKSEREALEIVKNEFTSRHPIDWVEVVYPSFEEQRTAALKRITQGYPPEAVQWHPSGELRKLQELKVLRNIDISSLNLSPEHRIPQVITDLVSDNGQLIVLPIGVHGENWLWFNKAIYSKLQLTYPKTWLELIAQAKTIKAAGYMPVAMGQDIWSRRLVYTVILNALSKDAYLQLVFKGDPNSADLPEVRQAFDILAELRELGNTAEKDTTWVNATRKVANGEAAILIMGDWANKEFQSLGKKIGTDYDCMLAPSKNPTYMIVVDSFVFPKVPGKTTDNFHTLFSRVALDPKIQKEYTLRKGSIPVLTGISPDGYDKCSQIGIKMLNDESKLVLSTSSITNVDNGAILEALVNEFWDTHMTPDEVIKQLKHDLQSANLSIVF